MDWARILAYITGTVDQELLLRNEYLVAENRILCVRRQLTCPVGDNYLGRFFRLRLPTFFPTRWTNVRQDHHPRTGQVIHETES